MHFNLLKLVQFSKASLILVAFASPALKPFLLSKCVVHISYAVFLCSFLKSAAFQFLFIVVSLKRLAKNLILTFGKFLHMQMLLDYSNFLREQNFFLFFLKKLKLFES